MGIDKKLVEVMKSVDSVPKNGWNDFHKYAYPEEADILRAVRGKLAELGIIILPSVESTTKTGPLTEIHTKHTFIDSESGETREVKWYGQGVDTADKGAYKAMTGAVKYLLLKLFLIPTGDDPEKDDAPPPPQNGAKAKTPPANGNGKPAEQNGNVSTAAQQKEITKLAAELHIDIALTILPKYKITWPPDKPHAEKIIARLHELKKERQAKA